MAVRRLLGIVFTPSWLRVAQAEVSRDRTYSVRLFAVPLPVGCINEHSGAIEDSGMLQEAMHSIPSKFLQHGGSGDIFMVIPQLLCYRTSFIVPKRLEQASMREILAAHPVDLPGDRSSLIVDASAHPVGTNGDRAVMVLAARRSSLEAYARLFKEQECSLGGIITGEIARYNRWRLQWPGVSSRVALICSADTDSQELSLWDRGVLTASDTRYWYQREPSRLEGNVHAEKINGASTERLAQEITHMIDRARTVARPIEQILLGGALRNHKHLQELIHKSTGIQCETSQHVDNYMKLLQETDERSRYLMQGLQEPGVFDDALGAIAPRVLSLHAKIRRWRDDSHQSYA
jgi:hypothetical protein